MHASRGIALHIMGMDVKSFYKPQLGNEATAKRLALPVESQVPRVIPKREQKRYN